MAVRKTGQEEALPVESWEKANLTLSIRRSGCKFCPGHFAAAPPERIRTAANGSGLRGSGVSAPRGQGLRPVPTVSPELTAVTDRNYCTNVYVEEINGQVRTPYTVPRIK